MELTGNDAQKSAFLSAMVAVQAAIPSVTRCADGASNEGRCYKYADLTAYVTAAKSLLLEHGLCFMSSPGEMHGAPMLRTMVAHTDGATLSCVTPLMVGEYVDMQGFGSAITYARRYVFAAIFNFAVEDDDGAAVKSVPRNIGATRLKPTVTVSQVDDRVAKIKAAPIEHLELLKRLLSKKDTPEPVALAARSRVAEIESISPKETQDV